MSFGLCPNWEDETGEIENYRGFEEKSQSQPQPPSYTQQRWRRVVIFLNNLDAILG